MDGLMHSMTPTTPLAEGEMVLHSFHPDRATYWRDHAWLAAAAMAIGMAILWVMGNPHVWTGAVGGLAAVAVRAFYVASDEMQARWDLTDRRLLGPQTRAVLLADIARVRTLGSAVQIVTRSGDKHLLKYQPDRDATRQRIQTAMTGARP
ncbi:hypothetical protein SAMN05443432_10895 [Roseovarius litoreus]|uniref:Uncharacterized protein n=1 Tax=Roseovarius litoreus TaxID=1155722 RepID=A0A1M7J9B0_9RHOB|nr:hypothetical protein [Roseovarius litoreus]SHM49572.1 hypothetical protein SAMN05443432_10895 [Roseovarius litoreus]